MIAVRGHFYWRWIPSATLEVGRYADHNEARLSDWTRAMVDTSLDECVLQDGSCTLSSRIFGTIHRVSTGYTTDMIGLALLTKSKQTYLKLWVRISVSTTYSSVRRVMARNIELQHDCSVFVTYEK